MRDKRTVTGLITAVVAAGALAAAPTAASLSTHLVMKQTVVGTGAADSATHTSITQSGTYHDM